MGPGASVALGDQPLAALHLGHLVHQVGKVVFVFFWGEEGMLLDHCRFCVSGWEQAPGFLQKWFWGCAPLLALTHHFSAATRILHRRAAAESLQEGSTAATIRAEAVVLITELRGAEWANESSRTTGGKAAGTFLAQLSPGGAGGTAHVLVVPSPGALHHCQGIPWAKNKNFSDQGAEGAPMGAASHRTRTHTAAGTGTISPHPHSQRQILSSNYSVNYSCNNTSPRAGSCLQRLSKSHKNLMQSPGFVLGALRGFFLHQC